MKEIYQQIAGHLEKAVPSLHTIDLDERQLPLSGSEDLPAALIDVSYPSCSRITRFRQRIDVTVTIRVVISTDSCSKQMKAERLGLVDEIHRSLQGWCACDLLPLALISLEPEESLTDGVKIYRLEFGTGFEERAPVIES